MTTTQTTNPLEKAVGSATGRMMAVMGMLALAFTPLAGCGAPSEGHPSAMSDAGAPAIAPPWDAAPHKTSSHPDAEALEALLAAYTQALFDRDGAAARKLLSSEIRARVANRLTALGLDETAGWTLFAQVEGNKLERQFGDRQAFGDGLVVVAIAEHASGSELALTLRHGDRLLPKAVWVVLDDGVAKLNLLPPASRGTRTFRVDSEASSAYTIDCAGGDETSVPAGGSIDIECTNTCGLMAGSDFVQDDFNLDEACDYNTWGWDVMISDSDAWCQDPC